jgi:5'-3' exonuclease
MGIPQFFRNFSERYPKCLVLAAQDPAVEVDLNTANANAIEFDNL